MPLIWAGSQQEVSWLGQRTVLKCMIHDPKNAEAWTMFLVYAPAENESSLNPSISLSSSRLCTHLTEVMNVNFTQAHSELDFEIDSMLKILASASVMLYLWQRVRSSLLILSPCDPHTWHVLTWHWRQWAFHTRHHTFDCKPGRGDSYYLLIGTFPSDGRLSYRAVDWSWTKLLSWSWTLQEQKTG